MELQGIRWAASRNDVERAVVFPGTAALFMYVDEDAFAIKSVDERGFASVSEYEFLLRKPPAPDGYVSKEEYDKLRKELDDAKSALSEATANGSGGTDAEGEGLPGDAAAGEGGSGEDG